MRRVRRCCRPAPRSCMRMLFPGTVGQPRLLPPFRVFVTLSPRHRRYDVNHTSLRCEGQVLRRGALLGGAVQGRAGGVIIERVDQEAHGGGGYRGYRGYQGSRRRAHRIRPLPRRRLTHPEPGRPTASAAGRPDPCVRAPRPTGARPGAVPRGTAPGRRGRVPMDALGGLRAYSRPVARLDGAFVIE